MEKLKADIDKLAEEFEGDALRQMFDNPVGYGDAGHLIGIANRIQPKGLSEERLAKIAKVEAGPDGKPVLDPKP